MFGEQNVGKEQLQWLLLFIYLFTYLFTYLIIRFSIYSFTNLFIYFASAQMYIYFCGLLLVSNIYRLYAVAGYWWQAMTESILGYLLEFMLLLRRWDANWTQKQQYVAKKTCHTICDNNKKLWCLAPSCTKQPYFYDHTSYELVKLEVKWTWSLLIVFVLRSATILS